ncbi:hypothetical protein K501DRAFT_271010 [Backusella circina FSU 941]|nr:hypothetical protein K501DRAFT_271010 [Backusella circina FSU 941]
MMSKCFVLLGGHAKKIRLENGSHSCPKCKRPDTVQLTRCETEIIIFNRKIEFPNNMRVRYECRTCRWKNNTLPEDDEDVCYQDQLKHHPLSPSSTSQSGEKYTVYTY